MAQRRGVTNPHGMYGIGGMQHMGYGNYMHPAPPVHRTQQRRAPQGHHPAPVRSQGHHPAPPRAQGHHPQHHPQQHQQHHQQQHGQRQVSNRGHSGVAHHPGRGHVASHEGGHMSTVRNSYYDNHQTSTQNYQNQHQTNVPTGGNVTGSRPAFENSGEDYDSADDSPRSYETNSASRSHPNNYNDEDNNYGGGGSEGEDNGSEAEGSGSENEGSDGGNEGYYG